MSIGFWRYQLHLLASHGEDTTLLRGRPLDAVRYRRLQSNSLIEDGLQVFELRKTVTLNRYIVRCSFSSCSIEFST